MRNIRRKAGFIATTGSHPNERRLRRRYDAVRRAVEKRIASLPIKIAPASVYDPIRFVLASGGKRLRAGLVLLSCEAVGGRARRALDAAVAVELLHNFTLVHDDLMDHAALRRGKPTVHRRWDENIAVLAGDEMIALAYRALEGAGGRSQALLFRLFTSAFIEVCEGQGFDKEFESRTRVTVREYLAMIRKKTARMISAACALGGVIGEGSPRQVDALRLFGEHLGVAFQMKDDLLDITGNEEEFGKAIGSDVIERKKTYLLLTALERTRGEDRRFLRRLIARSSAGRADVRRVRTIYERAGVLDLAAAHIRRSTDAAQRALRRLPSSEARGVLVWLAGSLSDRNS